MIRANRGWTFGRGLRGSLPHHDVLGPFGGVALPIFGGSVALLKLWRHFGIRHLEQQAKIRWRGSVRLREPCLPLWGCCSPLPFFRRLQRFDKRRLLILQEGNAIKTAAERLLLLDRSFQEGLTPKFKAIVEGRLARYEIPNGLSVIDVAVVYSREAVRVAASRKRTCCRRRQRSAPPEFPRRSMFCFFIH